MGRQDRRAVGSSRHLHSGTGKRQRQAVPDAGRGRILDHRTWNSSNRKSRKRRTEGKDDEVEIVGLTEEKKKVVVTGVEMFRKLLDRSRDRRQHRSTVKRRTEKEIERGQVLCQPGTIHPHTKFKGRGIRTEEGRRRKTHAVLQRIQTAVLLQNDRRNRGSEASGGNRDVHAWSAFDSFRPVRCQGERKFCVMHTQMIKVAPRGVAFCIAVLAKMCRVYPKGWWSWTRVPCGGSAGATRTRYHRTKKKEDTKMDLITGIEERRKCQKIRG